MTPDPTNPTEPNAELSPAESMDLQGEDAAVGTGSLLDDPPASAEATADKPTRAPLGSRIRQRGGAVWRSRWGRRSVVGVLLLALGVGGYATYLAVRPTPQPDILDDALDNVLDFTLLEDDFNDLPLETRIKIMTDLINRLKNMDGSSALLVAAFAEGVAGEAREQLERNLTRLAVDAGDQLASEYDDVAPEERDDFLDQAYVRLARLTQPLDSSLASKTDEQLLERARRDAQEGREFLRSGQLPAEAAAGVMVMGYNQMNDHASPKEQQRLTVFFRDMTRRFRYGSAGGGG